MPLIRLSTNNTNVSTTAVTMHSLLISHLLRLFPTMNEEESLHVCDVDSPIDHHRGNINDNYFNFIHFCAKSKSSSELPSDFDIESASKTLFGTQFKYIVNHTGEERNKARGTSYYLNGTDLDDNNNINNNNDVSDYETSDDKHDNDYVASRIVDSSLENVPPTKMHPPNTIDNGFATRDRMRQKENTESSPQRRTQLVKHNTAIPFSAEAYDTQLFNKWIMIVCEKKEIHQNDKKEQQIYTDELQMIIVTILSNERKTGYNLQPQAGIFRVN